MESRGDLAARLGVLALYLLSVGSMAGVPAPPTASAQLQTLGFQLDNESFVRVVAARWRPLIDLFLAAKVDVNAPDQEGRSALFVSVASGQWELARRLLAAGADPKGGDGHGRTALMAAILHGEFGLADELLDRGADPGVADENAHTALHFAVMAKERKLVTRLMSLTPVNNLPCCENHDLFTHTLETGDWGLIEPMLGRMPATLQWNRFTQSWLAAAITERNEARIRLLLTKHAKPPTPEGRKQPLLAYAMIGNNQDLFRLLLDCGADPNTALDTPAEKVFRDLLPASTVRTYLGQEPGMNLLMLAAGLGRPADVKLLLEKGAKRGIATQSKSRLVPLYFAAWGESTESMQILLNAPSPEEMRIEISIGSQSAALFKNGIAILRTTISTGRSGYSTPSGRFVVTDKNAYHISTIYKVKMPFFMRLSCRDFGLHQGHAASPFASHGCIRVPAEAARRLFQSVPVGTLVTISP